MLYGTEAGLSSIALLAKGQVSLDVLLDIKGQANQNISVMTPVTLFGSFFQKKKKKPEIGKQRNGPSVGLQWNCSKCDS